MIPARLARPWALSLLLGLALHAPGAQAAPPDVEALRARLASVRGGPGAKLPRGALDSIAYTLDVAERIAGKFGPQSESWRARAARFLDLAEQGQDPIVAQRGKILMRGYRSELSQPLQGYAIYIPEGYDPKKRYPLMIVLHGGSANGNLFLGVVLGNNMSWLKYPIHLWDDYEPRWRPDWIVVAPDGFGQVMWRWMGERDVLDVIDDVQAHYSVDADRIVLGGLSNGGVGAYNFGMRHAHRFSAVTAMAGAPSWVQYAGGRLSDVEMRIVEPLSGLPLIENSENTELRYYHGRTDTGPMKPHFVEELDARVKELGLSAKSTWYDTGHDILYLVHRHGRIYEQLEGLRRKRRPKEVRVVTGDYRANRQHWVTVTRIADYPQLSRVRAVVEGAKLTLETEHVVALSLDLRECPLSGEKVEISIDGASVYSGPRAPLGQVLHLARDARGWHTGFLHEDPDALEKKPGVSGPIGDAYHGSMLHVYGTGKPADEAELKRAAERGAKGWPLWLWRYEQPVMADRDVTEAHMRRHHLVLYGTPGANSVLEKIAGRLPIRVESDAVIVGSRRHDAKGVGVKLIHPNPLAPERYVLVQAAPTAKAVTAGNRLPDFLPDYVVYDARSTASRPRLVFSRRAPPLEQGFFDRHFRLPEESGGGGGDPAPETTAADGGAPAVAPGALETGAPVDAGAATLPVPKAPPSPQAPRRFLAPRSSQAGQAARQIARRVRQFENYRALTPGGRWIVDPAARWSIRSNERCLEALANQGIRARTFEPLLPTPVPTPIELYGRVDGVWFRMTHEERTVLLSCEMASRLPDLTRILHRHGVRGVDVMSAYRDKPRPSFHTMGLALDLLRFWTLDGVMSVLYDFEATPDARTCEAPRPKTKKGRALRDIACRLARSKRFSTVLTPNYNEGHRDHFHVDIRPDDPRVFLR